MDVLALTILLGSRYPSKNQEGRDGFRRGRKSEEYVELFGAVKEAAEREIQRTGWTTAECECFAIITRYIPDHRRCDSLNIGTAEANALTAAGVWTDDRLAQPCLKHIRYDDEGPHRVTIVVMKLYEPANVRIVAKPQKVEKARKVPETPETPVTIPNKSKSSAELSYDGGAIPAGYALVNGKPVPYADALAMITKKSA